MEDEMELPEEGDVAIEGDQNDSPEVVDETPSRDRQPEHQPSDDLDSDPRFRKLKSTLDRQINELRQQLSSADQRAWQAEQRAHQAAMEGMDEVQRKDYMIQLLQQQLNEVSHREQLRDYAQKKDADIRRIAAKKGLSYDELADALPEGANIGDLYETADRLVEAKSRTAQKRSTPKPADQANNQVDIGGGKPVGEAQRLQQRLDTARKNKMGLAVFDIYAEAASKGIELK